MTALSPATDRTGLEWSALRGQIRSRSQLIVALSHAISDGEIPAGDLLPPERRLAQMLSLSRTTVRGAMEQLESEGLIECRQGSGRRVVPTQKRSQGLASRTIALVSEAARVYEHMKREQGIDGRIQTAAAEALHEKRWHALTVHPEELAERGVEILVDACPAGVLVMNRAVYTFGQTVLPALAEADIAHVVSAETPHTRSCDRVVHDHRAGAADLTSVLLGRGHRRVLQVFGTNVNKPWHYRRIEGYRQAMHEAGVDAPDPLIVPIDDVNNLTEDRDHTIRVFMGYLHERLVGPEAVDAIVAATDIQATHIAEASLRLGRDPRRDLVITGYDANFDPQFVPPALSGWVPAASIDKRNEELGHAMVTLLEQRIRQRENPSETEPEPIVQYLPYRLVDWQNRSLSPFTGG